MSRPRIRSIKPELWQDEKIGGLSRDARLLFIGLITMADDEGRLRAIPSLIIGHVYPYDAVTPKNLEKWLAELEGVGLLRRYEAGGVPYIQLSGWTKHQKINRPSPSELPPCVTEDSVKAHGTGTEPSPLPCVPADRKGSGGDREPPSPPQAGEPEKKERGLRANGNSPRQLAHLAVVQSAIDGIAPPSPDHAGEFAPFLDAVRDTFGPESVPWTLYLSALRLGGVDSHGALVALVRPKDHDYALSRYGFPLTQIGEKVGLSVRLASAAEAAGLTTKEAAAA